MDLRQTARVPAIAECADCRSGHAPALCSPSGEAEACGRRHVALTLTEPRLSTVHPTAWRSRVPWARASRVSVQPPTFLTRGRVDGRSDMSSLPMYTVPSTPAWMMGPCRRTAATASRRWRRPPRSGRGRRRRKGCRRPLPVRCEAESRVSPPRPASRGGVHRPQGIAGEADVDPAGGHRGGGELAVGPWSARP